MDKRGTQTQTGGTYIGESYPMDKTEDQKANYCELGTPGPHRLYLRGRILGERVDGVHRFES